MPQHVHQEETILSAGVTLREHRRVARRTEDVRHAEAEVAHDRDAGGRRVHAIDVVLAHAEGRVLVEVEELRLGEPGRGVDEVAVHVELILHVRRVRTTLRLDRLRTVQDPVLARGQDVEKSRRVAELLIVALRGLGRGRPGAGNEHDKRQHSNERSHGFLRSAFAVGLVGDRHAWDDPKSTGAARVWSAPAVANPLTPGAP